MCGEGGKLSIHILRARKSFLSGIVHLRFTSRKEEDGRRRKRFFVIESAMRTVYAENGNETEVGKLKLLYFSVAPTNERK